MATGLLQKSASVIDALNERVGQLLIWLVLIMTAISAGNALVRKVFDQSSNALLEIQWYLFAAIFLLCAGYALKRNAHVRIDVLSGRFSRRVQAGIDIFGTVFFLLPIASLIIWLSSGVFLESLRSGEVSASAGGLIVWPARLLVPLGFSLLWLQGIAEIFKRILFLTGKAADPLGVDDGPSAEEELAAEILRKRNEEGKK